MAVPPSRSFTTIAHSGLLNVLKNNCGISQAYDPRSGGTPPVICEFEAIWDTGATNSVITQKVVDACGLAPIGMAKVHGVSGESFAEKYLVNIRLPNQVMFAGARVTKGDLFGADILIGMDIINQGDFAVTNLGGVTKFSFRIPSQVHIDFVEEANKQIQSPQAPQSAGKPVRPKRPKTFGRNKKK